MESRVYIVSWWAPGGFACERFTSTAKMGRFIAELLINGREGIKVKLFKKENTNV